jgi:flagellar basal-body rod modification protein FlgD
MAVEGTTTISPEASATLAKLKAEEAARNAKLAKDPSGSMAGTDQMGKDTFLKLLVAQLKYQNPMQPSDPSSFMAQTAQFSMVEKLEQMQKATDAMAGENRWATATNLLGKQITWTDGSGTEQSGVVSRVRMGTTNPVLVVGDKDVPSGSVTSVTPAPVPTTATAPVTAPVSTPVTAPVTDPVTDPVVDPVVDPVTDPVTAPTS